MRHPPPLLLLILVTLLAGGAGCAGRGTVSSLPPLPPAATLIAHPEGYRGQHFRCAAEIVAVVATRATTYLEVELLALDPRGRIEQPPHPMGRVFLRHVAPLDGSLYQPGRGVVGSVRFADVATGVVGEQAHPYPILDLLDHRVVSQPFQRSRPRIHLLLQGSVGL